MSESRRKPLGRERMSDFFLNILEDEPAPSKPARVWKIAVIDDEESVHQATKLALSNTKVLDRELEFLHAYSAAEGLTLITQHPDTAVVLLDVVMETPEAGLDLAKAIRHDLNNYHAQIILRTGQPGYAPEESVITDYEVNDYKTKSELTRTKLFSAVYTAVRAYQSLTSLAAGREGLRKIIDSASTLFQERSIAKFSEGTLEQINALFNINSDGIFCVSSAPQNPSPELAQYLAQHQHHKVAAPDKDFRVIATSSGYRDLFGVPLQQIPRSEVRELINKALNTKQHVIEDNHIALYLDTPSTWRACIYLHSEQDISDKVDYEILRVFASNVALGLENTKFLTQLADTAYKDDVTPLLNRNGLMERAIPEILDHHEHAVLYLLDIDYFHEITEALGFEYGNRVLNSFADKLKEAFAGDAQIARMHSDVFAAIVPGYQQPPIRQIIDQCSNQPLILENGDALRLGVTIGLAIHQNGTAHKTSPESIIRHAEVALNKAKEQRRGSATTYDESLDAGSLERLNLLSELRRALISDGLALHVQPQVDISNDSKVVGMEVLLRWQHDKLGNISPGLFVPLAERSGLAYELDLYVLRRSCELIKQYPKLPPISINLSAMSLDRGELLDDFANIINRYNITNKQISLEVTEGCLIKGNSALTNLQRLADAGWDIHLDDFGSGYSSLNYLLRLPISTVKIDRLFILELRQTQHAATLLSGIIGIILNIGKGVVVEGIETTDQNDFVANAGAKIVQGFLHHKPMPFKQFAEQYLTDH